MIHFVRKKRYMYIHTKTQKKNDTIKMRQHKNKTTRKKYNIKKRVNNNTHFVDLMFFLQQ